MRAHRPGGFHRRGPDFEAGAPAIVPTAPTGRVFPGSSSASSRHPAATHGIRWLPSRRVRDCPGGAALSRGTPKSSMQHRVVRSTAGALLRPAPAGAGVAPA